MKRFAPILAVILLSIGCKPSKSPEAIADATVLATVGDVVIRTSDLDAELAIRKGRLPSGSNPEQVLQELIDRAALVAHAREIGLDRDRDVARRIENILIAELKRRELQPRIRTLSPVPEAATPTKSSPSNSSREQLRLAVLQSTMHARTSATRRDGLEDRMKKARELALRLPADEAGFGALAVDYSDHQESRYIGGDRGWFDSNGASPLLPGEVVAAGRALQRPGDVSEIVRTDRGIFLVRLLERVRADSPASADSALVRQQRSVQQERRRVEAEFTRELRLQAGVQLNAPQLAHLASASTPAPGDSGKSSLVQGSPVDRGLPAAPSSE